MGRMFAVCSVEARSGPTAGAAAAQRFYLGLHCYVLPQQQASPLIAAKSTDYAV